MVMRGKREKEIALVEEIYRVQAAMRAARRDLDVCRNPRLLEAAAYELKYLQAKHAYLFEMARETACTGSKIFR